MPKSRSPNREKAKRIYLKADGNITPKQIAEKLNMKAPQVRQWKSIDKWEKMLTEGISVDVIKVPGKKGNQNARKHGLYARFMPSDTLEIINGIKDKEPIEILLDNIRITQASIIRSQQIMYVKDIGDMTKEKVGSFENGDTYDVQQAWDKQANFLQALSRSQATLNNMIKTYNDMVNDLTTEKRKEYAAKLAKLKAETDNIQKQKADTVINYYSNIPQADV